MIVICFAELSVPTFISFHSCCALFRAFFAVVYAHPINACFSLHLFAILMTVEEPQVDAAFDVGDEVEFHIMDPLAVRIN